MATTNYNDRIGFIPIDLHGSTKTSRVLTEKTFETIFLLLSTVMFIGGLTDTYAHSHGVVETTFFTPWHAILYAGSTSVMTFTLIVAFLNYRRGFRGWSVLPAGYKLTVAAFVLFGISGIGDGIWHTLFGFEVDIDASVSPTHLLGSLGAGLLYSTPIRVHWRKKSRIIKRPIPVFIAIAFTIFTISLMLSYAIPISIYHPMNNLRLSQALGLYSIVIWTTIYMGFNLLIVRRWKLPFGSFTLIWLIATIGIVLIEDTYQMLWLVAIVGLATDVLNHYLKPNEGKEVHIRLFATAVPIIYFCLYYMALIIIEGIFAWPIHMWTGSIAGAGLVGFLISYLVFPPKMPEGLGLER